MTGKILILFNQHIKNLFIFQKGIYPDLLATSGDYLRVWRCVNDTETRLETLLNNVRRKFSLYSIYNISIDSFIFKFSLLQYRIKTQTFAHRLLLLTGTK
jgi:hypothetical protein